MILNLNFGYQKCLLSGYIRIYEKSEDPLLVKKLLIFLNHLKCYQTLRGMSSDWDLDQKTIMKYVKQVINIFMDMFEKEWPFKPSSRLSQNPLKVDNLEVYGVIDTTIFPIQKPTKHEIEKEFYSVKHKFHGIKLEVVVNVSNGYIHWLSKDYYVGSVHDITISRDSGILDRNQYPLTENERILADLGYVGEEATFTIASKGQEENQSEFQKTINKIYYSVENIFARLKLTLFILKMPYRGDIDNFGDILQIIFFILNLEIENGASIEQTIVVPPKVSTTSTPSKTISNQVKPIDLNEENFDDEMGSVLSSTRRSSKTSSPTPKKVKSFLDSKVYVDLSNMKFFVDLSSKPQEHNLFSMEKVVLSPPYIFPISEYELIVQISKPFYGVKIVEYKILSGSYLGIKYHIKCPSREDICNISRSSQIGSKWVCTYEYQKYDTVILEEEKESYVFRLNVVESEEEDEEDWN